MFSKVFFFLLIITVSLSFKFLNKNLRYSISISKLYDKPPAYQMSEPKNAREMALFKNKVPFDEDVYEKIKFTIEKLTVRMKDKEPLSSETIETLENYISEILDDARKYSPPEKPSMKQEGDEGEK